MVSSRFEEKNEKYFSVKKEIKYVRKKKKKKNRNLYGKIKKLEK